MWPFRQRQRVPESIAVSAVVAASFSLHAGWIVNLLSARHASVREWLLLTTGLGTVGGYYVIIAFVYLGTFALLLWFLKGKDCSGYRDHVFWFFLAAVVAFIVLTLPVVYGFRLQIA